MNKHQQSPSIGLFKIYKNDFSQDITLQRVLYSSRNSHHSNQSEDWQKNDTSWVRYDLNLLKANKVLKWFENRPDRQIAKSGSFDENRKAHFA
jgi:hypothetical protein